jgi:hypothetical protein
VLVTASGSPGGGRLVRSLQENGERELRVVGTDMSARRGGRAICDSFHVVPPGSSDEFPGHLAELARRERVDAVFPLSSFEVAAVSKTVEQFDVPVLVASPEAIAACNDKARTMELCARLGVPIPRSIPAASPDEFRDAAHELGYPGVDVLLNKLLVLDKLVVFYLLLERLEIPLRGPAAARHQQYDKQAEDYRRQDNLVHSKSTPIPEPVDDTDAGKKSVRRSEITLVTPSGLMATP